jgi:hypothetical protein
MPEAPAEGGASKLEELGRQIDELRAENERSDLG